MKNMIEDFKALDTPTKIVAVVLAVVFTLSVAALTFGVATGIGFLR